MIRGRVLKFQRKVSRESLSLYYFEFKKAVPRINSTVSVDVELCNNPVELENVQSSVEWNEEWNGNGGMGTGMGMGTGVNF